MVKGNERKWILTEKYQSDIYDLIRKNFGVFGVVGFFLAELFCFNGEKGLVLVKGMQL